MHARATTNTHTALERLANALIEHAGWNVRIKRDHGAREAVLVIKRRGKPKIEFPPHRTSVNLYLLTELARMPTTIGGGGMTREQIAKEMRLETREERAFRKRKEA